MPTWRAKECLDFLISPITKIDNKSLPLGVFQKSMKATFIKPLIIKIQYGL